MRIVTQGTTDRAPGRDMELGTLPPSYVNQAYLKDRFDGEGSAALHEANHAKLETL